MCQEKHCGNDIDIPVSSKVTEGRVLMKPASLKRHREQKHRNKAVFSFTVLQLILNRSLGAADKSLDKGRQLFKAKYHTL